MSRNEIKAVIRDVNLVTGWRLDQRGKRNGLTEEDAASSCTRFSPYKFSLWSISSISLERSLNQRVI